MFAHLILALAAQVLAQTRAEAERIACDGVIFHDVYFDRKLLFGNFGRPNNLIMHKFSNTLFFSHTIQNATQVDFAIIACSLGKLVCDTVPNVPGGYAIGYDDGNDDIYLGGHEGIYKYNFLSKKAEFFAEEGKSIWGLFIKKNFYYIEYPTQKLFVYQDDSFVHVAEALAIEIDHFFISKHGDIYFSNKTALYKVEKDIKEAIVLNDELVVRQIAEDGYGDVYFCSSNGIYLEDKPYHKVKRVADINQAFGLAFDESDHVIYSDTDSIYILLPSKHSKLCLNAIYNPVEYVDKETMRRITISKRLLDQKSVGVETCPILITFNYDEIRRLNLKNYKMYTIVLLTIIGTTDSIPTTACNRLKIGDHWYDRNIIWANLGRPYNLNIHKVTNTMFFSYSMSESFSDVDFQLAYLNIDTNDYQTIAGIKGGCAVAIDQVNEEIYLGGSDGIYKFNMMTKLADFYKEKGKNIWSLFFKKNLFYVSYPDQRLHIEVDGKFARVKEFEDFEVDHFHISSRDNEMYFANKTGLYKFNNGRSVAEVVNELITVRQIVEDNNDDVYICTNFGVYIDDKIHGVKKIVDMKNMYGLAFDRDNNFIYSDDKSIVKLTWSHVGCVQNASHW